MSVKSLSYRLARRLCVTLPSRSAFQVAERLADFQWRISVKDRQAVQGNLSLILGRTPPPSSPMVRDVFRNFARSLVEFFSIHRVPHPEVIVEGEERLRAVLALHRGTIAMTGHLGNWELAAVFIQRMGIPVSAVALPHDDPGTNRLFIQQRARCGITTIPLGTDAAQRGLRQLRQGGLLGILGDREFSTHGLPVSLCGRHVVFPRGPAILSLRSGVPAIPIFLIREGPWKFRLCVEPPMWPTTGGGHRERAIHQLTQAFAQILERYLRHFPDQWLMFQPVARRRQVVG
jgi:KDO2-lipid IV(A) lauroyltransferase